MLVKKGYIKRATAYTYPGLHMVKSARLPISSRLNKARSNGQMAILVLLCTRSKGASLPISCQSNKARSNGSIAVLILYQVKSVGPPHVVEVIRVDILKIEIPKSVLHY